MKLVSKVLAQENVGKIAIFNILCTSNCIYLISSIADPHFRQITAQKGIEKENWSIIR